MRKIFEYFNIPQAFEVPPTPFTGLPNDAEDCIKANRLLMYEIKQRGYSIMTTSEKQGREVHDIIPIQGKEQSHSNEGAGKFPFHVEVPQMGADRPDVVVLYCVRGMARAETHLIAFQVLFALVKIKYPEVYKHLGSRIFHCKYGASFNEQKEFTTEIMHYDGTGTLDLAEMFGRDPIATGVLNKLKEIIQEHWAEIVYTVNLKAGDFLFFDNKMCTHARGDFSVTLNYDGTQRWLKRCYLKYGTA